MSEAAEPTWTRDYERARQSDVRRIVTAIRPLSDQLDQLVRLAADLFDTPVALVTLVGEERVDYVAARGLENEPGSPREFSICTRTIEAPETLVVEDARNDPRFRDHPMVAGVPYIAFYAGAVLRSPAGYPFGTLCLIDYAPRRFREREVRQLLRLARVVEGQLVAQVGAEAAPSERERNLLRDVETGLLKRRFLEARLDDMLAARSQAWISVVSIHLENLAELRAALAADDVHALVAEIAARLRAGLPEQVTGARWDTAEYIFIAPSDVPGCRARELAETAADLLNEPVAISGHAVRVHASVGIAESPEGGSRAATLIDLARSAGRQPGGERQGNVVIAGGGSQLNIQRRVELAQRLHSAIANGAISAWLQPRVDAESGVTTGAEALARWHDPDLGEIEPDIFIPLAESMGTVADVGSAMLDQVCAWLAHQPEQANVPVAVNVAPGEISESGFVERIRTILARHGVAGDGIVIEITENALLRDIDAAQANLAALGADGVRFAIDDYGSGYSSLQHLRRLPLHQLKIDSALVVGVVHDANARAIIRAIVAMGRALDLEIVAEGVETADQAAQLRAAGCRHLQGFYFGEAVPLERFDYGLTRSG